MKTKIKELIQKRSELFNEGYQLLISDKDLLKLLYSRINPERGKAQHDSLKCWKHKNLVTWFSTEQTLNTVTFFKTFFDSEKPVRKLLSGYYPSLYYKICEIDQLIDDAMGIPFEKRVMEKLTLVPLLPLENVVLPPLVEKELKHIELRSFSKEELDFWYKKGLVTKEVLEKQKVYAVQEFSIMNSSESRSWITKFKQLNFCFAYEIIPHKSYKLYQPYENKRVYAKSKTIFLPNLNEPRKIDETYAYTFGLDDLRINEPAILCAGEPDCLALKAQNINAFTLGSEQKELPSYVIKKLNEKNIDTIRILYDTDLTGIRNSKLFVQPDGFHISRLELPKLEKQTSKNQPKPIHNDVCDYLNKHGVDYDFLKLVTEKDKTMPMEEGHYADSYIPNMLDFLFIKKKIVFTSGTGSGKTFALLNTLPKELEKRGISMKICVVEPLIAITQQNELSYKITSVHGSGKDQSALAYLEGFVSTTYESLDKIKSFGFDLLIIDEAHNMISQQGFRSEVISQLQSIIKTTEYVIFATATPQQLLRNSYPVFELTQDKQEIMVFDLGKSKETILFRGRKNSIIPTIQEFVKKFQSAENLLFVKVNNTDYIRYLEKYLVNSGLFDKGEIASIYNHPEIEKDESYQAILDCNAANFLPQKIRIILCTSKINDGVNIYTGKKVKILNCNLVSKDFHELTQLVARVRNQPIELYNLLTECMEEKQVFALQKRLGKGMEKYSKISAFIENLESKPYTLKRKQKIGKYQEKIESTRQKINNYKKEIEYIEKKLHLSHADRCAKINARYDKNMKYLRYNINYLNEQKEENIEVRNIKKFQSSYSYILPYLYVKEDMYCLDNFALMHDCESEYYQALRKEDWYKSLQTIYPFFNFAGDYSLSSNKTLQEQASDLEVQEEFMLEKENAEEFIHDFFISKEQKEEKPDPIQENDRKQKLFLETIFHLTKDKNLKTQLQQYYGFEHKQVSMEAQSILDWNQQILKKRSFETLAKRMVYFISLGLNIPLEFYFDQDKYRIKCNESWHNMRNEIITIFLLNSSPSSKVLQIEKDFLHINLDIIKEHIGKELNSYEIYTIMNKKRMKRLSQRQTVKLFQILYNTEVLGSNQRNVRYKALKPKTWDEVKEKYQIKKVQICEYNHVHVSLPDKSAKTNMDIEKIIEMSKKHGFLEGLEIIRLIGKTLDVTEGVAKIYLDRYVKNEVLYQLVDVGGKCKYFYTPF